MKRSDSIDKLAPALVAAQAEMPIVERDGTANSEDSGRQYAYTSLGSMLQAVRPVLSKHGLCVIQGGDCEHVDGHICMETTIIHESGQYICGTMRIPFTQGSNAAQAAGAAITYCRRYAFSTMLGVTSEEDTDAARLPAEKPAGKPAAKPAPAKPKQVAPEVLSDDQSMANLKKTSEIIYSLIERVTNSPENKAESVGRIREGIKYAESLHNRGMVTEVHLNNLKDMVKGVLGEDN